MSSEYLSDVNVMDESILSLLAYWDMEGTFKKMGVFDEKADMETIYRHVITSTL